MSSTRASDGRVRTTHRQTRATLRWSLGFVLAAVVAAGVGAERWMPLHLLLAGGVALAISGVTLMLTVTWSAAPAPANALVTLQRSLLIVGAAGVVAGREADAPSTVTGAAGGAYLIGLLLLAVLLVTTVGRGSERRFDVAVGGYVGALVLSIAAIGVGIHMVTDVARPDLRAAHATLNLLGFVGMVVGTTLPFFGSTVGRSKMSHRVTNARLGVVFAAQWGAAVLAAVGILAENRNATLVGLGAYGYGILVILVFMPKMTQRQFKWAGPRMLALWVGALWWCVGVLASAYEVAVDDRLPFTGRWLLVVVVGGYVQVVWGALAYLLPMLRGGGHENLSRGFATTRSWVGFGAVNVAGLALALALNRLAAIDLVVLVGDTAWRLGRVGLRRLPRPSEATGAGVVDPA